MPPVFHRWLACVLWLWGFFAGIGADAPGGDRDVEAALDEAVGRLPSPIVHREAAGNAGSNDRAAGERYAALVAEKRSGEWFAAMVSLEPATLNAIDGRFATRRGFFDFIEERNPLVEVWAWRTDGKTEDGVPGKRLTAEQLAQFQNESPAMPTFVTLTFRTGDSGEGPVRRYRVEFGFQVAAEALARTLAYEKSRRLQVAGRRILSARDSRGRLDARSQWEALESARESGTFDLAVPVPRPTGDTNLFVAFEFAVDADGNLARPVVAFREDDIEREVVEGQIRLRLRQPDGGIVVARAFRRVGMGDAVEPALNPVGSRDFVELRLEDPLEKDPRRWNLLEFGEPDVLQQLALARFGLINAYIDRRIKILGLKRANLDMFVQPVVAGLNIGGGVSGVGFPIGAAVQLGYNVVAGPRFLPKVPSPQEMRELFLLLAARKQDPELRHKPDDLLTRDDLQSLRKALERLTDQQVQDTLESLDDGDLRAMLAIAKLAGIDAKYSLFVNILSGAAVVSGQAYSGAMREIFNNPYYSLNGDIYINYIMAAALGNKLVTPAGGASLYSLARGNAPAEAWLQYLGISFDLRALMNSVSRLRFRSLADKELRMPFPYAARMNDLAAYEIRIFGYPILLFYKRGLLKDDLKSYDNDYAYGLIGRRIAVHFPTKESMESEIVAGHMIPLGYVKVSDGKGGTRDSNLAVFAYRIPDGPDRGQIAMILYGLKAYNDYSALVERQVARLREFERGLEEGLVIEQVMDVDDGPSIPSSAREPQLYVGEAAVAERYTAVLAPLMEWRRLLRRRELGLPEDAAERARADSLRRQLEALSIPVAGGTSDPLMYFAPDGSRFRHTVVIDAAAGSVIP